MRDPTADKPISSFILLLNNVNADYIQRRIDKGTITFPYLCSVSNGKIRLVGHLCRCIYDEEHFHFRDYTDDPLYIFETISDKGERAVFTLKELFGILSSYKYFMKKL